MANLSIIEAAGRAVDGTATRLFKPFNAGKWFALGFSAWLATLGEGYGGPANFNRDDAAYLESFIPQLKELWHQHAALIVSGAIGLSILVLALTIVISWLQSRGRFMFLHNVLEDTAKVAEPWNIWRTQGNSLFIWQLGFIAASLILMAIILGVGMIVLWPHMATHRWHDVHLGTLTTLVFSFMLVATALSAIQVLLKDFVVPVMMKYRMRTNEAWAFLTPALKRHFLHVALYLLFKLVFMLAVVATFFVLTILTCCCFLVLLAIPYINAVVTLPVLVFSRLFAIEFMRGFGDDFDLQAATAKSPAPDTTSEGVPSPS